MDKPREIDSKVGRLRPVGREIYDRRAATAVPSATGGRPATSGTSSATPLAAATGEDITARSPLGDTASLFNNGSLRYARSQPSFLPQVPRLNRTLEQYTVNNEDMVNITARYIERAAERRPELMEGFDNPTDAAQYVVAMWQRSFEPGDAPRVLDTLHQTRAGVRVYNYLKRIEEAANGVES